MFIFVKHYEFMRKEFGEGLEKGVYSKIFSYYEFNGTACEMSYNQWAEHLKCAKSTAQTIISGLIAKGYISAEARSDAGRNLCTAYTINESKLNQMLAENGLKAERDAAGKLQVSESDAAEMLKTSESDAAEMLKTDRGIPEIGTPYTENRYTPIPENGTPTITENKTEIIDRECDAPAHDASESELFEMFGTAHNVPLTAEQYRELESIGTGTDETFGEMIDRYSERIMEKGLTAETVRRTAFTTLKRWIEQNHRRKSRTAETRPSDTKTDSRSDAGTGASFTDAEFESLANAWI